MPERSAFGRHFEQMAAYNRWANARLYADAARLSDEARHRDVGVYFSSLFATLAHLLQSDRAWRHLLQGGTLADMQLSPVPAGFEALQVARCALDDTFVAWMAEVDESWLASPFSFTSGLGAWNGMTCAGTRATMLTHIFNHQTHHRGQAHTALSLLGVAEPQALDMVVKGFLES